MFEGAITHYGSSVAAFALILAVIALPCALCEDFGMLAELSDLNRTEWYTSGGIGLMPTDLMKTVDYDNINRYICLNLYLVEKQVFGHGNITIDNETQKVVAGGFLDGEMLKLYLIPEEMDLMFKLDCRGYSSDGENMSGSGSRSVIISDSIPVRRVRVQMEK